MQTTDLRLTATLRRPETLSCDYTDPHPGVSYGRITYLIIGIPVDVPLFEVLRIAQHELSCQPSPTALYIYPWASLYCANRR